MAHSWTTSPSHVSSTKPPPPPQTAAPAPFRVRSYRRAAEAVEQQTTQLATLTTPEADPKALLAIPGIGKGMAANIRDLVATGTMQLREELLTKYKPSMLELLRLPAMGPKTVAMLY